MSFSYEPSRAPYDIITLYNVISLIGCQDLTGEIKELLSKKCTGRQDSDGSLGGHGSLGGE
jgi:hypothetical protein